MTKIKIKAWIHAARLRTLPLAISGILLASFIAYGQGLFHWSVFSLALITTLLLQILSNLANDYGDFAHGTDNENRVGPERAVQSGIITPREMKGAMYLLGILAFVCGIILLALSLTTFFNYIFVIFLLTGIISIGAAIKYTVGKSNYGYKGFGDIMVFLFFGIAAVWGTHFLHTLEIQYLVLLPAAALGLLSTGVLNVNNMRDRVNDEISGKITLAVRLGKKGSKAYHILLITLGISLLAIYLIALNKNLVLVSLIVPVLPLGMHVKKIISTSEPKKLDPELKRLSLSTLFISLWLGIALLL